MTIKLHCFIPPKWEFFDPWLDQLKFRGEVLHGLSGWFHKFLPRSTVPPEKLKRKTMGPLNGGSLKISFCSLWMFNDCIAVRF